MSAAVGAAPTPANKGHRMAGGRLRRELQQFAEQVRQIAYRADRYGRRFGRVCCSTTRW
jgi:hypothetical protein